MNGLFLAIDQSTSATKALLFSSDGLLLDQQTLSHRQIYPSAGWVEHDADEIFNNTLQVTSELMKRHTADAAHLLALSITNQRETFVVFDRETGQPLHNAIVWQCRRGADLCTRLVHDGHEDLVHELTGLKIDTYFPPRSARPAEGWLGVIRHHRHLFDPPSDRRAGLCHRSHQCFAHAFLRYRKAGLE